MCYGSPNTNSTFDGYGLVSISLADGSISATKQITSESVPELGLEIGGAVEQQGLAIFANRKSNGNQLSLIYYYNGT